MGNEGLFDKYEVYEGGDLVDEPCFVIMPESDPAARAALRTYARATENDRLAADLRDWIRDIDGPERGPRV